MRNIIEAIVEDIGNEEVSKDLLINRLDELTKELHRGAIWKYAEDLAAADTDEVRLWMFLASKTNETNERELSEGEYLQDVERIKEELAKAVRSDGPIDDAVDSIMDNSSKAFEVEDDVAFGDDGADFLHMAISGQKSGVVRSGDLMFVGANELDYSILEAKGLKKVVKEDRGSEFTFYQNDEGVDVVKVLYPGFCIVLSDESLSEEYLKGIAKDLARSA